MQPILTTPTLTPFTAADYACAAPTPEGILRMAQDAVEDWRRVEREKQRLEFQHRVLARAAGTLDVDELLAGLGEELAAVAPVVEIMAAFVGDADDPHTPSYRISETLAAHEKAARRALLLEALDRHTGPGAALLHGARPECRDGGDCGWDAHVRILPLRHGGRPYGVLALVPEEALSPEQMDLARSAAAQVAGPLSAALEYGRVRRMASRDGLTGLYNRRAFDERLTEEVSRHRRAGADFTLLMFDIDHFKNINDTHGHEAGDEVLRNVAAVIRTTVRLTDFAARYGGEEFAVILINTGLKQAEILAERLRLAVARSCCGPRGAEIRATVSIGIARCASGDDKSAATLVGRADAALYQAKNNGRNQVRTARSAA
jgi:diguanylate cyclase (GGDEF)-like protein